MGCDGMGATCPCVRRPHSETACDSLLLLRFQLRIDIRDISLRVSLCCACVLAGVLAYVNALLHHISADLIAFIDASLDPCLESIDMVTSMIVGPFTNGLAFTPKVIFGEHRVGLILGVAENPVAIGLDLIFSVKDCVGHCGGCLPYCGFFGLNGELASLDHLDFAHGFETDIHAHCESPCVALVY